jgi:aminoglycoside phosphotransferase (APT) family kinase protein
MRQTWERQSATLELTRAEVAALATSAYPGRPLLHHQVISGGLSNTNIRLTFADHPAPVLLRIYVRDPAQAAKEWALLGRLAPVVPVPHVHYTALAGNLLPYPYALMDWIEGERLETVLEEKFETMALRQMMRDVGGVLARIHALRFDAAGFLDSNLNVVTPISVGSAGLLDYLGTQLGAGSRGRERLGASLADRVLDFAVREGGLLDTWCEAPSLTHGDFGGSNILMRQGDHGWRVTGIVDWEFAFSGSPFFDFGNLLRPPLGARSDAAEAVAAGYREAGGDLPPDWHQMTLLVELISWAEFLGRPNLGPHLTADARAMMRRVMNDFSHHR